MDEERRELCVIGAGTAGFSAAEEARRQGRDVLLLAGTDELGGTCIRRGCMPAKTVLAASQYEGEIAKARAVGVATAPAHLDLPAIVRRKRALVDYFAEDRLRDLAEYPLLRGDARFVAPDAVAVGTRRVIAERFVVATGASVVAPPIAGLDRIPTMTSTDVMEMTRAPRSLVILGGGPIGCAFAQFFARLGTVVTLLQDAPELLRGDDADVGGAVRDALERDGVNVMLDVTVVGAERDGDAAVLTVDAQQGRNVVRSERVLLATNRRPRIATLDLATGNVATNDAGGIAVDATLRSITNPRVFAAGDVLGRRALVHTAAYAGRLAAANAFAERATAADWDRWEAHAVYTQPQIAVAGLTERECRARGVAVRVARVPATEVGKAVVAEETDGFVKMIARAEDGRVVGIAIVADDAVDLGGEAIALVDRGLEASEIAEMPHLHPTMSELFARVAERLCSGSPLG